LDKYKDGWMDKCKDGWIDFTMDESKDWWKQILMKAKIDRRMGVKIDIWMGGLMYG